MKASPACPPTHPHSLSPSRARLSHREQSRRRTIAAESIAIAQLLRRSAAKQLLTRIEAPCTALHPRVLRSLVRGQVRVRWPVLSPPPCPESRRSASSPWTLLTSAFPCSLSSTLPSPRALEACTELSCALHGQSRPAHRRAAPPSHHGRRRAPFRASLG